MEWLWGAFAGGAIGLGSALIVTEYTSRRDRQRRQRDYARSLQTEICLATQALESIVNAVKASKEAGKVKRVRGPVLTRDVYTGCIGDLALFDSDTRYAVQNFCSCVDDVEYLVSELSSRWSELTPHHLQRLRDRLLQRAELALERAAEALAGLNDT